MINPNQMREVLLIVCPKMADETNLSLSAKYWKRDFLFYLFIYFSCCFGFLLISFLLNIGKEMSFLLCFVFISVLHCFVFFSSKHRAEN